MRTVITATTYNTYDDNTMTTTRKTRTRPYKQPCENSHANNYDKTMTTNNHGNNDDN